MKRLATTALSLALVTAACGTSEDTDASQDPAADSTDADGPALALSSVDLGDIVVDDGGETVYLFIPDDQGESTCYDECEATWPVVAELGGVGDGLDESLVGVTTRTDGTVQATYNGWPIYYFANDTAPGDVNGQGVKDVWYVFDASGNAIGQS